MADAERACLANAELGGGHDLTRLVINLGLCHSLGAWNPIRPPYDEHIYAYDDELRVVSQAMYVFSFSVLFSKTQDMPNYRLSSIIHPAQVADQSPLSRILRIL